MAHNDINKINIFLDTNIIEARHEENCLVLNSIKLHPDFYKLLDFGNDLSEVSVYVPSIVWKEVCVHLSKCFNSTFDQLHTKLNLYKKTFGDLIDLSLDEKGCSKERYLEHLTGISDEFWVSMDGKCRLVDVDIPNCKVQEFIDKAINSVKPFTKAKGVSKGQKEYSDAGFKDALIVETILSVCKDDEIAILFTDDNDYNEVFKMYDSERFIALKTLDEVKTEINKTLKRNDDVVVKAIFEKSSYMQETLFSYVGIPFDRSITGFEVESVDIEDELYLLKIKACTNEVEYDMNVRYDMGANDIVDVQYTQHND